MQRNHVVVALLKRGGSTKSHRKANKAKRKFDKQELRKELTNQARFGGFSIKAGQTQAQPGYNF